MLPAWAVLALSLVACGEDPLGRSLEQPAGPPTQSAPLPSSARRLAAGEMALVGTPPEGTYALVREGDTLRAIAVDGRMLVTVRGVTPIDRFEPPDFARALPGESFYFQREGTLYGWWPALGATPRVIAQLAADGHQSPGERSWSITASDDGSVIAVNLYGYYHVGRYDDVLLFGARDRPLERVAHAHGEIVGDGSLFLGRIGSQPGVFHVPRGQRPSDQSRVCGDCDLDTASRDGRYASLYVANYLANGERYGSWYVIRDLLDGRELWRRAPFSGSRSASFPSSDPVALVTWSGDDYGETDLSVIDLATGQLLGSAGGDEVLCGFGGGFLGCSSCSECGCHDWYYRLPDTSTRSEGSVVAAAPDRYAIRRRTSGVVRGCDEQTYALDLHGDVDRTIDPAPLFVEWLDRDHLLAFSTAGGLSLWTASRAGWPSASIAQAVAGHAYAARARRLFFVEQGGDADGLYAYDVPE